MAEYITHEHDVVIIGAGGAGLRAAIEASAAGVKVAVIYEIASGQSPYRHGRRWRGRSHGKCGRSGQLARSLCRHHARRPISE